MDIFDRLITPKKDLIDRVLLKKLEGDVFERIEKKVPSVVRNYVKGKIKPTLTPEQISELVISTIEKNQPKTIEKIIEKRIEVVPPKIKEPKNYDSIIQDLKKQIEELKNRPTPEPEIRVIGSPLPNYSGKQGNLYSDGNKIDWVLASSGGSSSQVYTPTNVTTDRSFDANDTSLDELADVLGSLIIDLQAAGIIQ